MTQLLDLGEPDEDLCCIGSLDSYFQFVCGTGRIPIGINRMSAFLEGASATSTSYDPHAMILDTAYGIDASDLLAGANLMSSHQYGSKPEIPLLGVLRDEQQASSILVLLKHLVRIQSGAVRVLLHHGTIDASCESCMPRNDNISGLVSEREVINTLLRFADLYDFQAAGEMTRQAQSASDRIMLAKVQAMSKMNGQGVVEIGKSELIYYLTEVCDKDATVEDNRYAERLVRAAGGKVHKVRLFSTDAERRLHVERCVNNTRAIFAVEEVSTQFLEQLAEGLEVVVQPQNKTFRKLLQERK